MRGAPDALVRGGTLPWRELALRVLLRRTRASAAPRRGIMFSIDHLGIAVKSLTAAKAIYEKLGLSVSPEETVEHEQVKLVMVPVGESRLELLEATSESSTIAKFIAKRGEGLHHICMKVPDLVAAVDRLRKDGVRLVSEEIKTGAGGHQYVFVHPSSTGGVLLELVQA
jgi:methylmalonyl-CoA epimerase